MAAIYEFHVAGMVGSVVRSALPELQMFEQRSGRVMHGTATERGEIDRLLELIQTFNLNLQRLQICERPDATAAGARSGVYDHVPVVDDGGAQGDVLQ
jgi:hypothetical protein